MQEQQEDWLNLRYRAWCIAGLTSILATAGCILGGLSFLLLPWAFEGFPGVPVFAIGMMPFVILGVIGVVCLIEEFRYVATPQQRQGMMEVMWSIIVNANPVGALVWVAGRIYRLIAAGISRQPTTR